MRLSVFDPDFREDLRHWVEKDRRMALRLLRLVEAIMRDPFAGEGKPEPLRGVGANIWSRRIDKEHRIVYHVDDEAVTLLQALFHYDG